MKKAKTNDTMDDFPQVNIDDTFTDDIQENGELELSDKTDVISDICVDFMLYFKDYIRDNGILVDETLTHENLFTYCSIISK